MPSRRGNIGRSAWTVWRVIRGTGADLEWVDRYRFGAEKGKPSGPDRATTTVAEDLQFKLSAGGAKVSFGISLSAGGC